MAVPCMVAELLTRRLKRTLVRSGSPTMPHLELHGQELDDVYPPLAVPGLCSSRKRRATTTRLFTPDYAKPPWSQERLETKAGKDE